MVTQQAGTVASPGSGVLLSGTVPPLADAYYPREQSGPDLASTVRAGETVVLIHGEETAQAPAAQGGTGKTQLAVEFTHAMWNTRAVEILIWVNAASRESVITGFAQAANTVDAAQPDEGAETAAARFVSWLAHTRRPWALVIDDLAELSDLEDLWPSGASGRVLITTRLPASAFEDAAAEGGPAQGSTAQGSTADGMNLRVVPVPGLNRREALDYVTSRLSDYPDQRIEALDLGEDLDGLPLALAQATAAMSARRQGCREYRALLAERVGHMPAVPGASAAASSNALAGSLLVIRTRPDAPDGHRSSRSLSSARSSMISAHGRLVWASQETNLAAAVSATSSGWLASTVLAAWAKPVMTDSRLAALTQIRTSTVRVFHMACVNSTAS